MIRAIALSLALLLGIGTIIPFATDYSEARVKRSHKKKKVKKYKKYSKKWWRQYRQRMKKRKAIAARKRALRVRQILLARARKAKLNKSKVAKATVDTKSVAKNNVPEAPAIIEVPAVTTETPVVVAETKPAAVNKTFKTKNLADKTKGKTPKQSKPVAAGQDSVQAVLPTGEIAPQGWKRGKSNNEYQVDGDDGRPVGTASISDVGPVAGEDNGRKTLGGVPTSALRRTVIDKMVREEGWVVNDFQKEVNGKKVYVVVAQSPGANGTIQSRIFYFTESNGRIYSLATNSSTESAERLAKDSERIITSFHRKTQSAELR